MRSSLFCESDALNFLDLGSLALTITQIVQLGTANLTAADHFDMVHTGRIDRESTFNANAVGHPANRKCFTDTAVALRDNSAFESLQTFTVAFNNLDPYAYGVTDIELRQIAANLFCFDGTDNFIHGNMPPSLIDVRAQYSLSERINPIP